MREPLADKGDQSAAERQNLHGQGQVAGIGSLIYLQCATILLLPLLIKVEDSGDNALH